MIPDPKLSDPRLSDSKLPFASAPVSVAELKLPAAVSVSSRSPSFARLWLRRIGVLFFVFLCATLGVMLMILPWRPEWSDNPLLFTWPTLRTVIAVSYTHLDVYKRQRTPRSKAGSTALAGAPTSCSITTAPIPSVAP